MKTGNMVRFNFNEKDYAYGVIVWVDGLVANVDYKNPETLEHEVKPIELTRLTKIGNK